MFFLLLGLKASAQQKIYIHLNDTTLEYYTWDVREITFAPIEPLVPFAAPEPVDLGLSVKWASYNLGATTPAGTGFLVGWGEPTGVIHQQDLQYYPKRVVDYDIIGGDKDIAAQMWGSEWRLPSATDFQELIDSCTWEWADSGYTITSNKTQNSIFLPIVKHLAGTDSIASPAYYWTGIHAGTDNAYVLSLTDSTNVLADVVRYLGCAVRPVYGEYRLPVTITVSEASDIAITSAKVTMTLSGYVKDIKTFGVQYAITMDSLTNNTAKTITYAQQDLPESGSLDIALSGLNEGNLYFYRAFAASDNDTVYTDANQFSTKTRYPIPEYVDLGLPSGTKWAAWNMGAQSVTDYGSYIGWGDVTATLTPNDKSSSYAVGNTSSNIAGNPKYDIVNAKWGGYWQLPTVEQYNELANEAYTTWEQVSNYQGSGIDGFVVTSLKKPGASIFLPMAGYKSQYGNEDQNSSAYYWTSQYDLNNTVAYAERLLSANYVIEQAYSKPFGFTIRGVYAEPITYPADSAAAKSVKAVDLGLSVDWADQNIKSVDDPTKDAYFAWGAVKEQAVYNHETYEYEEQKIAVNDTLTSDKDAAVQNWGGTWRMPTIFEMMELVNNCTWELTTQNGVKGYKVSGNGNSIFLPMGGHKMNSELSQDGVEGIYWTKSDFTKNDPNKLGYAAFMSDTEHFVSNFTRAYGCVIRPVRDKR